MLGKHLAYNSCTKIGIDKVDFLLMFGPLELNI